MKTMAWRCDDNFRDNLDKLTIGLAKGASMGLITYLAIKLMGVAHDNKWEYIATGWGLWYIFEMGVGVILPLILFGYAIRRRMVGLIRFSAFLTVFGVVLNRLNTGLITFNWKLAEREIPTWREAIISITLFSIYVVVWRFILYRLPILYTWKTADELATATVPARGYVTGGETEPAMAGTYRSRIDEGMSRPAEQWP
jgi:hypothetical protein